MEEGCLVDEYTRAPRQVRWVQGPVEVGWFGLIKKGGKEKRPTWTYRCTSCGFLESYAGDPI
jgi:hypothetical protein